MKDLLKITFLIFLAYSCQNKGEHEYQCEEGVMIEVVYKDKNSALMTINGKEYELYSVVAASGARYATEHGINPEQGMSWHTKDDGAVLRTMTLDDTATPDMESTLFNCRLKK